MSNSAIAKVQADERARREGKSMTDKSRTSQGLRDILFNEIEALQSGSGDPRRALAVSQLAGQIVNTVRVELDLMRQLRLAEGVEAGDAKVGTLELGTSQIAGGVGKTTMGR